MKKAYLLFICALCSCAGGPVPQQSNTNRELSDGYTTSSLHNKMGAGSSVENNETILALDDHLRGLAGINITGDGIRARVTVRGVNSFQAGSSEPLFVINGTPMGSYVDAFSAVNSRDIKRVSVLTDAASTGIYGVRGANGVIIVTLKNTK